MQISLAAQAGNRLRTSFLTPYVCNYPYCLVSSFMSWTPSQCRPAQLKVSHCVLNYSLYNFYTFLGAYATHVERNKFITKMSTTGKIFLWH